MTRTATPFETGAPAPVLARFSASCAQDTADLAQRIGQVAGPGDVILLSGQLGSGKTHFARALIRSRQAVHGTPEDVPSPSFTLVQTYRAGALEIWHADLYRLGHPDELVELGLEDAMDTALCLIEWPERMTGSWPRGAVRLALDAPPGAPEEAREITLRAAPGQPPASLAARIAGAMGAA